MDELYPVNVEKRVKTAFDTTSTPRFKNPPKTDNAPVVILVAFSNDIVVIFP